MWSEDLYGGDIQLDVVFDLLRSMVKVGKKLLKNEYDNIDGLLVIIHNIFRIIDESEFLIDQDEQLVNFLIKAKKSIELEYYTKDEDGFTGFSSWNNPKERKKVVDKIYKRLTLKIEEIGVNENNG